MNGIEKQRNRSGLTQQELAKKLNVTQGAVSQWEKGRTIPSTKLLPKMSYILECKIDDLLDDASNQ